MIWGERDGAKSDRGILFPFALSKILKKKNWKKKNIKKKYILKKRANRKRERTKEEREHREKQVLCIMPPHVFCENKLENFK